MTAFTRWFVRNEFAPYLLLAFGISWAGVIAIVGLDGIPVASDAEFRRLIAPLVVVMLLGPSVGGLVATALDGGRAALRKLGSRMKAWRVESHWYAVALLTAPLVLVGSMGVLALRDPWFKFGIVTAPRPMIHLLLGLLTGAAAGFFEEIGWTGYLTPVLRRRFSPTIAGLVLGIIWGLWHAVASLWGSTGAGDVPLAIYLPVVLFTTLVPYRILMTWVHERTQSVFVAMLMHGSLTASLRILEPIGISGGRLMAWCAMTSAVFCLLAVSYVPWRYSASGSPPPSKPLGSSTGPGGF